jgi:hypothetical protein
MRNKRKRLFVDPPVQGAILWRLALHGLVFVGVMAALLFFIELMSGSPHRALERLGSRHAPTFVALAVLMPIFVHDVCKLTNRFTGPMVRLRRGLRDIAEGRDTSPIKFRDGDFWSEVADDFNRAAVRIRILEAELEDARRVAPVSEENVCV